MFIKCSLLTECCKFLKSLAENIPVQVVVLKCTRRMYILVVAGWDAMSQDICSITWFFTEICLRLLALVWLHPANLLCNDDLVLCNDECSGGSLPTFRKKVMPSSSTLKTSLHSHCYGIFKFICFTMFSTPFSLWYSLYQLKHERVSLFDHFACGSVWVWNLVSDIKGGT
jgi:hypothetical protein